MTKSTRQCSSKPFDAFSKVALATRRAALSLITGSLIVRELVGNAVREMMGRARELGLMLLLQSDVEL